MASRYTGFDLKVGYVEAVDGVEYEREALIANEAVAVHDVTVWNPLTGEGAVALDGLESDEHGHVASGVLDVDAARTVRFSWHRAADGACGFAEQVTTEV